MARLGTIDARGDLRDAIEQRGAAVAVAMAALDRDLDRLQREGPRDAVRLAELEREEQVPRLEGRDLERRHHTQARHRREARVDFEEQALGHLGLGPLQKSRPRRRRRARRTRRDASACTRRRRPREAELREHAVEHRGGPRPT